MCRFLRLFPALLLLAAVPALAFNPPEDSSGGVKLRIEAPAVVERAGACGRLVLFPALGFGRENDLPGLSALAAHYGRDRATTLVVIGGGEDFGRSALAATAPARNTLGLATGSIVSGVLAYAVFALTTRALGSEQAAPVAVLWTYWGLSAAALTFPIQHWIALVQQANVLHARIQVFQPEFHREGIGVR